MPPWGFRKRERSLSPPASHKAATPRRSKPTLFETMDGSSQNATLEDNRKFLQDLEGEDHDSSLSEAHSDEFEDVPPAKRRKLAFSADDQQDDVEDEEDEMEWEDAIQQASSNVATPSASMTEPEITDLSISMNDDGTTYIEPLVSAATGKKGPSKRERQVRIVTHCLHVQALMRHNMVRNTWLNDKEVQKTLVDGLSEGVKREVQSWKKAMAALKGDKAEAEKEPETKGKDKKGTKGKQKSTGRDWNAAAESLERAGDPLLRLLKVLTAYWRKRFTVTAPGLRKQGYKELRRVRDELRAWARNPKDVEACGERIENKQDFLKLAKTCEGSRDVGAQLFVALLRGLGLETRMVANLQPIGFGWSKAEEADLKKLRRKDDASAAPVESDSDDNVPIKVSSSKSAKSAKTAKKIPAAKTATRKSTRGNQSDPIALDDSDSPLSEPPSEREDNALEDGDEDDVDDDDLSVVDITPSIPKKKATKKYDRDLAFPNYWTEVCSPISHRYYPVDPIVLATIASNDELLQTFEPRGKRAEKAKQVMCYTIAFSPDKTAKDVTVRYLKRHQLPGKTKGMRMPVEKIPILNRKGKVKRYEEFDWFRQLMLFHERAEIKRTAADELEEKTDLKPFKPAKEEKVVAKESLQGYKQSADYVLEQHLRREEALLPGAEPVKYFTSGKGEKAQELPVYNRNEVVTCKTVESWHKEGREIKTGEQPLKYVPVRAVTLLRKREMEDVQRETGEKMKQGLYSEAQTDWIIPPPIRNGVIPKNAFGNMDVYVPTMVPEGAEHLPLKGSAKLCRKLQIDYAEACTGFEFGKQRAVPVLTGVVVARENATLVKDAWRAEQKEIKRKVDTKRTAAALHWWRKMVLGLRVLERMRVEYAGKGDGEDFNPFARRARDSGRAQQDEDMRMVAGGGFFPPGHEEEEVVPRSTTSTKFDEDQSGGFLVEDGMDLDAGGGGGGFLVNDDEDEDETVPAKSHTPITPVSLQSLHKMTDGTADSDDAAAVAKLRSSGPATNGRKKIQAKAEANSGKPSKAKGRPQPNVSGDEEDELSSLSDFSDPEESITEDVSENDDSRTVMTPPRTKKKTKAVSSPQIIVVNGSGSRTRTAKKSTPVRSQYFHRSTEGDASDEENDDDVDEDDDSEVEVVKPRKTTARTRAGR